MSKRVLSIMAMGLMVSAIAGAANAQREIAPSAYDGSKGINSRADMNQGLANAAWTDPLHTPRDMAIQKDRDGIKNLKKQLKTAQTDDERTAIKAQIHQLESHIIAIQQS